MLHAVGGTSLTYHSGSMAWSQLELIDVGTPCTPHPRSQDPSLKLKVSGHANFFTRDSLLALFAVWSLCEHWSYLSSLSKLRNFFRKCFASQKFRKCSSKRDLTNLSFHEHQTRKENVFVQSRQLIFPSSFGLTIFHSRFSRDLSAPNLGNI